MKYCRTKLCRNVKERVSLTMMGTTEDLFIDIGQFKREFKELLSRHLKPVWEKQSK